MIKDKNKLNSSNSSNYSDPNDQNCFKELFSSTVEGDSDETLVVKSSVKLEPSLKSPDNLRKRNVSVNWDSPIKKENERLRTEQRPEREEANELAVARQPNSPNPIEDDGFESYNTGKSSSGEDNMLLMQSNSNLVESNSDTDTLKNSEKSTPVKIKCPPNSTTSTNKKKKKRESSDTDEENNEDVETITPNSSTNQFTETEYIGVTTNSDYSSEIDQSEELGDDDDLEFDASPTTILNSNGDSSERVSVLLWTKHELKKAEMSVLDISKAIIERVEAIPETCDYVYIGLILSVLLSLTPAYCRLCEATINSSNSTEIPKLLEVPRVILLENNFLTGFEWLHLTFGKSCWEKAVLILSFVQRLILTFLFFFLLAVAERAFKQR